MKKRSFIAFLASVFVLPFRAIFNRIKGRPRISFEPKEIDRIVISDVARIRGSICQALSKKSPYVELLEIDGECAGEKSSVQVSEKVKFDA